MIPHIYNYLTPTGDLILKEKQLKSIPSSLIPFSTQIIHLDLRDNCLSHLNSSLSSLSHLRSLDLRNNILETLSEEISALSHLKILRLDNNHLTFLPTELFSLTSLSILTLNRNSLYSLPPQIQYLKNLLSLIVSSNYLKSLPAEISSLTKLKVLYIHGNDFASIPTCLYKLTGLNEFSLEWFRYAVPPLPRVLKSNIGEALIESFRALCLKLVAKDRTAMELKDFAGYFSEEVFDVNRVDLKSRTALHLAVLNGDNGVIHGLVAAGCNINAIDSDGYSAFMLALKENNIVAAGVLMNSGADLAIGSGFYGSALNMAVLKSEPKLVEQLLKRGLSPNNMDYRGNTCLHSLVEVFDKQKHRNCIIGDLLVKYGVSFNAENNERWTAVHLAAKEKQLGAIKWMKKTNKKMRLNKKEGFDFSRAGGLQGWSPLHIATHLGDYDIAESLISNGANPVMKDYEGKTPKDTSKGNLALFKYLGRLEKECMKICGTQQIDIKCEEPKKMFDISKRIDAYRLIYGSFEYKDREELEELIEEIDDPAVKADAIYLVSLFKQKKSSKVLYKAKKCKEVLVKNEVVYAMDMIRTTETSGTRSTSNLKLTRHITPQASLPNLSEFIEEETRVDTLLLL